MTSSSRRHGQWWVVVLLVALAPATTLLVAGFRVPDAVVPWAWVPSGILAGLALAFPRTHTVTTLVGAAAVGLACVLAGTDPGLSATLAVALVLEVEVVRRILLRGRESFAIRAEGDIGRLIGAATASAAAATMAVSAYLLLGGESGVRLVALQVFLTHASSTVGLLPFFLPSTRTARPMSRVEAAVQATLLLSLTFLIFFFPGLPPLYFALLPTFAWLAFRSSLRWGAVMLAGVGAIATSLTLQQMGPVWEVVVRFDLPASLVPSLLSLFLLDCALVMFPIAVVVTQQREAAQVAHAERERLARVVDATSSAGIVATDPSGTITLFSPGAATMLRRDPDEVLGRSLAVLGPMTPEDDAHAAPDPPPSSAVHALLDDSGAPRRAWCLVRGDGEQRTVAVTVMATTDIDGRADGFVATLEDLTDQRATHEALTAALEKEQAVVARLSDLDQVKSAFVATVSHELRTPVTSINGYVEMLCDGDAGDLTPDQQAVVRRVSRNARRLHLLIEDLLLVSRIETRSLSIDRQEVDLGSVVREVVLSTSAATEGRGLEISLPDPEHLLTIEADPTQLERLVGSVVDNALKFTPDGGRVEVSMISDGSYAELTVTDSGVGIPVREQAQLFTPFFRSSTAVELATQGAGMGLTIARALAEAHGGSISLASAPETGTAVLIRLPVTGPCLDDVDDVAVAPAAEHVPVPRSEEQRSGTDPRRGPRSGLA